MQNLKENKKYSVHQSSFVATKKIGKGTTIRAFCNVLSGARIGIDCNINDHVFIENDVIVGDRVTIKYGVQLWDGLRIEDNVFIGPNATFTNDKFPRSKKYPKIFLNTTVKKDASIGANATILPGVTIGENAMIGAGAVVTKNVPRNAIVTGNPARITGYVNSRNIKVTPSINPQISFEKNLKIKVKGVRLIKLPNYNDIRGDLSVVEFKEQVPFLVKRSFIVHNVPNQEIRGEHAHKKQDQFLICISGSLNIIVDDGKNSTEITMKPFDFGIYVPRKIWSVQYKFSKDAALLVFSSDKYDSAEYIRSYDEYLKFNKR